MLSFKGFSQIALLSLSFALLLSACSLPAPQKGTQAAGQEKAAAFYLSNASGKFTTTHDSKNFSIPVSRTLSVKACFNENRYNKPMMNSEFDITGGSKDQHLEADASGCLVWDEEIPFNAMAPSKNVLIARTVSGFGHYKGERQVQLIINPWEQKVYSLTDSRVSSYLQGDEGQNALEGASTAMPLLVTPTTTTLENRNLSTDGHSVWQFRANVGYETKDVDGNPLIITLNQGKFRAKLSLIQIDQTSGNESRRVLYESDWLNSENLINGLLFVQTDLPNLARICVNSKMQMGIRVEAVDAPTSLTPYEGVFDAGDCNTNKGNVSLQPDVAFQQQKVAAPKLSIKDYVAETPATAPIATAKLVGGNKLVHLTAPLTFSAIDFDQKSAVERVRNFNVTACLASDIDNSPIQLEDFNVQTMGKGLKKVTTNQSGCLSWDDKVAFNYYEKECWKQGTVQITGIKMKMNEKIPVQYNAWFGWLMFRDVSLTNPEPLQCATGETDIMFAKYDFNKVKVVYSTDDSMELENQKIGNFLLSLTIRRPSRLDPSTVSEVPAPPGPYLVRLAMVDASVSDYSKAAGKIYMARDEVMMVTAGGMIQQQIMINTRNTKGMGNTNQLLFEVLPLRADAADRLRADPQLDPETLIDPVSNVRPFAYSAPITMANNAEGGITTPLNNNGVSIVKPIIEQFRKDKMAHAENLKKTSTKELFAQQNRLILMNASDEKTTLGFRAALTNTYLARQSAESRPKVSPQPLALEDLQNIIKTGTVDTKMANLLCQYWFEDYWQRPMPATGLTIVDPKSVMDAVYFVQKCSDAVRENPRRMFDIESKYFVKGVTMVAPASGIYRDFSTSDNLSYTYGRTTSDNLSTGVDFGIGKFLGRISTAGSVSVSWAKTISNTFGHTMSINFSVEAIQTHAQATDYEKCVSIRLNPLLFQPDRSGVVGWLKGVLRMTKSPYLRAMNSKFTNETKLAYAQDGYLLCDGHLEGRPIQLDETYYLMNQIVGSTQASDSASERFRPLFTAIRGTQDFAKFLSLLQGVQGVPDSFKGELQQSFMSVNPLVPAFLRGTGGFPGVVSKLE